MISTRVMTFASSRWYAHSFDGIETVSFALSILKSNSTYPLTVSRSADTAERTTFDRFCSEIRIIPWHSRVYNLRRDVKNACYPRKRVHREILSIRIARICTYRTGCISCRTRVCYRDPHNNAATFISHTRSVLKHVNKLRVYTNARVHVCMSRRRFVVVRRAVQRSRRKIK